MADSSIGGKIGTRVADIVTRASLSKMDRATPLLVRTGMAIQDAFFDLTGREVFSTVGPLFQQMANMTPDDDWARRTLQFMANGKGQMSTVFSAAGISTGFGTTIGNIINNQLAPVVASFLRANPNAYLTPADAANALARGLADPTFLRVEALSGAVAPERFEILTALAQLVLSPLDVLDLFNRGFADEQSALALLQRAGMAHDHAQLFLELRHQLVSAPDLAVMQLRGIIDENEGRILAGLVGVSPLNYDRYALAAGEPPDLTSTILAWRRGIINESDVDRQIRESRLRPEWAPVIKQLQWDPLPVAEAADAVNQGHLSLQAATQFAIENGVKPELFQVIVDNAGIPPGPQEALTWVSRGIISETQFRTIFLESRIKNKYIDLYLQSRPRQLTLAETRLLYRDGAMTKEQAIVRLQDIGYSAENAAIIVAGASAAKTTHIRQLTHDQITQLLQDQLITEADALALLEAAGFDAQEAQWTLDLASLKRIQQFTSAALTEVRSRYVGHKIDANAASAAIDQLGIAPDARDNYLGLWDIERSVVTKELTAAEVLSAAKKGIITANDAGARLAAQGYALDDVAIKLALAGLTTPPTTGGTTP
jgi:hypothetical protein